MQLRSPGRSSDLGKNAATALVPLPPAASGVLPPWQEGLWVLAAPGGHTWLARCPSLWGGFG